MSATCGGPCALQRRCLGRRTLILLSLLCHSPRRQTRVCSQGRFAAMAKLPARALGYLRGGLALRRAVCRGPGRQHVAYPGRARKTTSHEGEMTINAAVGRLAQVPATKIRVMELDRFQRLALASQNPRHDTPNTTPTNRPPRPPPLPSRRQLRRSMRLRFPDAKSLSLP